MKYTCHTLGLLLLITVYAGAADVKNEKVLSLNECINIALQNNSNILISEEDKKKALAEYRVALAQRLVFIDGTIKTQSYPKEYDSTFRKKNDKVDLGSKYYNVGVVAGVQANISLYNDKKGQNQKLAKTGMKLSTVQARKATDETIFNVKKAYYLYNFTNSNLKLQEKILKSNEERLKITQMLFKNAQKPIYDLSKAKLDLSQSRLDFQKAKNNDRVARVELFKAMGIEDKGMNVSLEDYEVLPEVQYPVERLKKLGEEYYPDLQIVKIQKEMNKIKVAFEFASHYPEVDFQAGAFVENGGFRKNFSDNFKVGWTPTYLANFIVRVPLFSSGAVTGRVESAQREYNKSIYKEKDALVNMNAVIESNYTSLRELAEQINISKLMKENAEKHMLLAKKSYESGTGTQLELHDANISLLNSQMSLLKARYDYLVTIGRLSSIVGLGEDSLCKK